MADSRWPIGANRCLPHTIPWTSSISPAAGLTDVVLPELNLADLEEIPAEVRNQMRFHPVTSVDQVLEIALEPTSVAMAA